MFPEWKTYFLHFSSYAGHSFVAISGMMLMHLAAMMLIETDGWKKIFFLIFFSYVKTSKERPADLLLDIRDSHLSIAALECIKDNGVTVLSFRLTLDTSCSRLAGMSTGHSKPMSIVHVTHGSQTAQDKGWPSMIYKASLTQLSNLQLLLQISRQGFCLLTFFPTPETSLLIRKFCHPT